MQGVSEEDTDELSDTCKEEIGLNGNGAVGFTGVKGEGVLEDVNGSFNSNPVPVKVIPVVGVSGDTGIEAEVLVGVGINALAISGSGTGMVTNTNPGRALGNRGRANPFKAGRTVFSAGVTKEGKWFAGKVANGSTGSVEIGA